MTRRNRRPRFNGAAADHAATETWFSELRTSPEDGTTYELGGEAAIDRIRAAGYAAWDRRPDRFDGASDVGVMVIEVTGPAPPAGYQPQPASFPALPAAIEPEPIAEWEQELIRKEWEQSQRPILRAVPVTEAAVIGDYLRLPHVWCDMPSCISFHRDPAALGERDARHRAHAAGWRTDALGRLACPPCQQTRADYRTPQPLTWCHPEVARRWHAREPLSDTGAFRLGVEAELGRRINREDPALGRAIAGATYRTAAS